MKRHFAPLSAVLTLILLLITAGTAQADSLWNNNSQSLYVRESVTYQVGQLITLIIVEQASASYKSGTGGEEAAGFSIGPGQGLLTNLLPYLEGSASNEYSGKGSTTRDGKLSAKLTVAIVNIDPQTGNLLVEGKQKIKVNENTQELVVRGRIRPQDITANNTIYSSYMADAEIIFNGTDYSSKPGILSRFFAWLL